MTGKGMVMPQSASPKCTENQKVFLGRRMRRGASCTDSPTAVVDLYPIVQDIDDGQGSSNTCCLSSSFYETWEDLFATSRSVEQNITAVDESRDPIAVRNSTEVRGQSVDLPDLPDISVTPTALYQKPVLERNVSHESKVSRKTADSSASSSTPKPATFQEAYVLTRQVSLHSFWPCCSC